MTDDSEQERWTEHPSEWDDATLSCALKDDSLTEAMREPVRKEAARRIRGGEGEREPTEPNPIDALIGHRAKQIKRDAERQEWSEGRVVAELWEMVESYANLSPTDGEEGPETREVKSWETTRVGAGVEMCASCRMQVGERHQEDCDFAHRPAGRPERPQQLRAVDAASDTEREEGDISDIWHRRDLECPECGATPDYVDDGAASCPNGHWWAIKSDATPDTEGREVRHALSWLVGDESDPAGTTQLHKMVTGAIRSAADAHGEGRPGWIGSAAKRVVGDVKGELQERLGSPAEREGRKRGLSNPHPGRVAHPEEAGGEDEEFEEVAKARQLVADSIPDEARAAWLTFRDHHDATERILEGKKAQNAQLRKIVNRLRRPPEGAGESEYPLDFRLKMMAASGRLSDSQKQLLRDASRAIERLRTGREEGDE